MKPTQNRILIALGLLVIAGTLVFTSSCGTKTHKIDDTTVLPFKNKAELDKLLDLPILPEYTIEEYYTKTDLFSGDEQFVVCCKFVEEVPSAKIQEIVKQVDDDFYRGWYTFDMGRENNMRLFFDIDTTLTADQKRPDILGDRIHVEIEMPCREKDTWKGFEIVFRNDRADYSIVVDRDTLSKVLGVDFPPLTETERIDESIFYDFDSIPAEEFYQALEKAPHWTVFKGGDYTFYDFDYDDGNTWITAEVIKGDTHFSFTRVNSINANNFIDMMKRMSPFRDKNPKSE